MSGLVTIYTDGACRGNPGPGGWGVVLQYGDKVKELHGGETMTTNNRMELTAVIRALQHRSAASRRRWFFRWRQLWSFAGADEWRPVYAHDRALTRLYHLR